MSKVNKAFKSLPADAFLPGATMKEAAENFTNQHGGLPQCKKEIQQKLVASMTQGKPEREPITVGGVLGFYYRPRAKSVSYPKPRQTGARRIPQRSLAFV